MRRSPRNFHEPSYGGNVTVCRHVPHHEERRIAPGDAVAVDRLLRPRDPLEPGLRRWHYRLHGPGAGHAVRAPHRVPVSDARHHELRVLPRPRARTMCRTRPSRCRRCFRRSAKNDTWNRNIGTVPSYVTGPATKACGGCHRAALINEDKAGELAVLNQHFRQGGYLIEAGDKPADFSRRHINDVMALFK